MGTDVVVVYVRETPDFSRIALRKLIIDLWQGRGAKVLPARWSREAAERCWGEHDALLGYALSPTSEHGWIAVLESANAGVRMDKELLSLLGARTTCWLQWACDHSNLYGEQRISKGRTKVPLDFEYGRAPYDRLEGAEGWEFLAFSGAGWSKHRDFAISERTKKHAVPKAESTADTQAAEDFLEAVSQLDVDAARTALAQLTKVNADLLDTVFTISNRVEFEPVANCVLRVGSALAERCVHGSPREAILMTAEYWVRLLETAAICDDGVVKEQALAGLAKAQDVKPALAEALARFDATANVKRNTYDGRAAMKPAGKRFRLWTHGF